MNRKAWRLEKLKKALDSPESYKTKAVLDRKLNSDDGDIPRI